MLKSIQTLFDNFPEGIIQAYQGIVHECNAMAQHYLPHLTPGCPLPDYLLLSPASPVGEGHFALDSGCYNFSATLVGDEQIVMFRPAPQTALTDQQLSGTLHYLRDFLNDLMAQSGPYLELLRQSPDVSHIPLSIFSRSFHRAFRLVGNLEYLEQAASNTVRFHPTTIDLEGLCQWITGHSKYLLKEAQVELEYHGVPNGLLIPGDSTLLQRLILTLISNSALATPRGKIIMSLRHCGSRALITLANNGSLPNQKQMAALLQQDGCTIPLPGQGAGLGMTIARDIVSLHKGTLLFEWGNSSPVVVLSLPSGPLSGKLCVSSPRTQQDGGLDPIMVELSDILPSHLFGIEGLD